MTTKQYSNRMSDGERMAIIETKVNNISSVVNNIDKKLDDTIKTKADKEEVKRLRNKVNRVLWWSVTGIITLLLTVIFFLIKNEFFS